MYHCTMDYTVDHEDNLEDCDDGYGKTVDDNDDDNEIGDDHDEDIENDNDDDDDDRRLVFTICRDMLRRRR